MNSNLVYLMALTYIPGIGPMNQRRILKTVEPEELWSLSEKELKEIFRGRKEIISYFQSDELLKLAQKELEFCSQNQINILEIQSSGYPEKLKNCSDSPLILFKKGNYLLQDKLQIGIVGTRKMTAYGKKFIEELIENLTGQKIGFVSGLAYGCDIEAHRNCIRHHIPNVAVLAHGLNRISPSSHKKESREIVENGALLTEYSSFHNAEPINFVLRNRIIAGLCDAVIVVESDKKGGALATAQYANSYNREVFAVPGRVEDKFSLGCNELIQSNQAVMIRNAGDLLNYFNLKSNPKPIQTELFIELDPDEKLIYEFLKKNGRQQIDFLSSTLEIPIFRLNSILLNLELKGVIQAFSGKFYGLN